MAATNAGPSPRFPQALLKSRVINGAPLNKILWELVVYPKQLTVADFDWILNLYETVCAGRIELFKIAELPFWSPVSEPILTRSAREAPKKRFPFFEASRRRIEEGRALEAQLWDGREITDPAGTYNLSIQALKRRSLGLAWYVRLLFPLTFPPAQLPNVLRTLADRLDIHSGHGGPVFAFNKDQKYEAFSEIYAKSRRFWGVDIDLLDLTPFRMREALKPPCWLNAIGAPFLQDPLVAAKLPELDAEPDCAVFAQRFATVVQLGSEPDGLDRNRPAARLRLYQALARIIDSYVLSDVGPVYGGGFANDPDAVNEWLHRFSAAPSERP